MDLFVCEFMKRSADSTQVIRRVRLIIRTFTVVRDQPGEMTGRGDAEQDFA